MDTLRIGAVVALSALAACSAGGSNAVPAPSRTTSAPDGASRASLTIVVPRAGGASSSATRRSPRYVSPSSAQLQVAVNGGAPTTYGLTPQSPGCVVQAGNLNCTFAIPGPAGSDTLSLALLDGVGNVLSRNIVSAKLGAGTVTPVAVTLAGVPASVVVVPGANAVIDSSSAPYHAPGLFPQPVEVEALDADGNVIIGPGAPTITSVSVTTGAAYATIASAQTTDPAAYLLAPVDGTAGGKTVTVSATAQGVPLADGSTSPPITSTTSYTFTPAIAIANGPGVLVVSLESRALVAALRACPSLCPLTFASGVAADPKGTIYLLYSQINGITRTSTVAVFPPGLTMRQTTLSTAQGVHGASGIAVGPGGALYVANGTGFRQPPPNIVKFAPGATTPSFTIPNTPVSAAGIAVDAAGNIYLADPSGSDVKVYKAGSTTASTTLTDPSLATPDSLAVDANGGLYVADVGNNDIAYFAAGQTALTATLTDPSFSNGVHGMMIDPTGNLWASLGALGSVERIAAGGLPNTVSVNNTIGAAGWMAYIP